MICNEVLKEYNPSEISRLYELCKASPKEISCEEQHKLLDIIHSRDSAIAAALINKSGTRTVDDIQKQYDRLTLKAYNRIVAAVYYEDKMAELNRIKPLADSTAKNIKAAYERYMELSPGHAFTDDFNSAVQEYVTDPAYYAVVFRSQISDVALAIRNTDIERMRRYRPALSRACMDSLRKIITEKSRDLALLSVALGRMNKQREEIFQTAANKYDSLMEVQLIKDGAYISSSIMVAAIRMREALKLRTSQVDSLVERGMNLARLKDSAWKVNVLYAYDAKDYENFWTSKILDDEQFAMILRLKNQTDARKNAENDWIEIEKRGLAEAKQLDKDQTITALTWYYTKVKSASSMYAYDQDKQSAYIRSVRADMPPALKMLQYARKNNVTNASAVQQLSPDK
jgi:hypothetical protein